MNDHRSEPDVVIVGAGPVGLMLAAELCLAGLVPVVLERLPEASDVPKGNGLFGQIVDVLDYRGLLEPLRADTAYCGPVPGFDFGPLHLDFSRLPASPLSVLAIPQRRLEQRLADRLLAAGGSISRGHEVTALAARADGVTLQIRGPAGDYSLSSRYVVGCDGARGPVRKLAGIGFPGVTSDEVSRIGRVRLPTAAAPAADGTVLVPGAGRLPLVRSVQTERGSYSLAALAMLDKHAEPGFYIVATRETGHADPDAPMTLAELSDSVHRVLGADLPMSEPQWLTRTVGNSRLADSYRAGPVLLAGDAAHIFGIGGSLNVGLLDAINLGWKLAADATGRAPAGLLDSYETERRAAAQRTLLSTRAQRALSANGEYAEAIRGLLTELLAYREPLQQVGEMIAGADLRYDRCGGGGQDHPLAGWLMPDLTLATAAGSTRVAELIRAARPVLLDFTARGHAAAAAADWGDRVRILTAAPAGPAPALAGTATPAAAAAPADAVLIRPDGWVAWASGPGAADPAAGLTPALRSWCA
jgi:2-polyprenyl-6-methoxyphenol hydroxylase-like FAD-dependent oxidoreductase